MTIECHCVLRRQDIAAVQAALVYDQFPVERYGYASVETMLLPKGWSEKEMDYWLIARTMLAAWVVNPNHNIVFLGNVGVGKTHMAAVAYNDVHKFTGLRPVWLSVTTFVGQMAALFSAKNGELDALLALLSGVPVLVLDDLGRGGLEASQGVSANLYKIINNRYNALLPTIVTTNLLQSEMSQKTPAIADRLFEVNPHYQTVFPLQGKSFRQTGGQE